MRKKMRILFLFLIVMISLSSCQTSQVQKPITITINYPSIQTFNKMYGYAFETKFPYIDIQVIQDDGTQSGTLPSTDVIYMNGIQNYKKTIEDGELRSLNLISKSLISGLSPIVTTLLSSVASDGQYYAIAPTFHSQALYYNKDIFDQYKVQYPTNGMSWKDVFALAMQFPTKTDEGESFYGMQMNYYRDVTLNIIIKAGEAEQLSYIDPKTMKVVMNSENWKEIWSSAIQAFRAGVIYDKGEDMDSFREPAFITADAAMTVGGHNVAYNFEPWAKSKGIETMNWDMVSVPIDGKNPDYTDSYNIYDYYGISSDSEHPEEALELLKFIAGDPVNSRLIAQQRPNYGLPAIEDHIIPIAGHDLSALYSLNANPNKQIDPYLVIEPEIIDSFKVVAQSLLDKAILGELTIEEALAQVEVEGQAVVDQTIFKLGAIDIIKR